MAKFSIARLFELEMGSAFGTKRSNIKPNSFTKSIGLTIPPEHDAVALRWRLSPWLGIPTQPFKVWRRISDNKEHYKALGISKRTIFNGELSLNGQLFYDIVFAANNPFAEAATLFAVDEKGNRILSESVSIPAGGNTTVRFRAPNINRIAVTNGCEIASFMGVTMHQMVNAPDWKLFEIVGLPYAKGEVPDTIYESSTQQGRISSLTDGKEASLIRVDIARLFYQAPPTIAFGLTIPSINAPKGAEVLQEILGGPDNLLELLTEMFKNSSQTSFTKRQVHYSKKLSGKGIHQPSSSASSEDSEFEIPLVSTTLLSTSMDMWACLGLGFGTTDIVNLNDFSQTKYHEPSRRFRSPFDYMVSAEFQFPGNFKREFAALSRYSPVSDAAQTPLFVGPYSENRPLARDTEFSEDLELRWARIPTKLLPVSYFFARSDNGPNANILNGKRPFTNSGYYGYIPAVKPDEDVIHEVLANYIDPLNKNPFVGTRSLKYLKIASDVFGRWTNWVQGNYTLTSKDPHMPAVLHAEFLLKEAEAVGKVIPSGMNIEIAWDWEDRSPSVIEIVGKFNNPKVDPGATAPSGFQKTPGAGFGPVITLTFDNSGINQIPDASGGARVIKKTAETSDGQTRKYVVSLEGLIANFTGTNTIGYAVYARASEKVSPAAFSDFGPPKTCSSNNPLPADIPTIIPKIYWTALPDATGYARYHLNFTAAPGAAGYVLYEATELGLRDAIGLPTLTTTDIIARANDLLDNASNVRTKDAFIRKNRELLAQPETTVNLPATASGFYVYCITSVTSEQVESEMSGWLIVAVPHRTVPAPPILEAKPTATGIQLNVEPYGNIPSKTIELYRTRSEVLVTDIDIMGNPVAYDNDPRWQKLDVSGELITGATEFPFLYRLLDDVTPSWLPYYYRAVAFGEHNPSNGVIKGRSKSSNLVKVSHIPTDPPDISNLVVGTAGSQLRLTFQSRAERWASPMGSHKLKVLTIDRNATTFEEVPLLEISLPSIAMKSSSGITPLEFKRTSLDANKRWTYEGYIPMTNHQIVIRLTDPKGRTSELREKYVAPPVLPKMDIVSLSAKLNSKRLSISFKSGTSIKKPRRGTYVLEIFSGFGITNKVLISTSFHLIPVKKLAIRPGRGISLPDKGNTGILTKTKSTIVRSLTKDAQGRYIYVANIPADKSIRTRIRAKSKIIVRITGPLGIKVQMETISIKG